MPAPPVSSHRPSGRRFALSPGDRRGVLGACLLLFAALALFGARYHWVEEAGSAERDGYVAQAESLLAGGLPQDPFRPAFYPLAVAAVASLGVPTFDAARLLSNLSAAVLAGLAWGFGRRLWGPPAGWAAFALTAVNPNLWILGQHTTTDMPFAALAAAALLAAMEYVERARGPGGGAGWRLALAAGAFLGLATFTRANGLFLAPALGAAWWLGATGGGGKRPGRAAWGHLLLAAVAAVACLLPHFLLRAAAFGDPFHDENWKNLAFKLYGFPDWSYLDRVPFDGLAAVVAADPGRVLGGFAGELGRFLAGGGVSQLLGTPLHALLAVAGAVLGLWTWRRRSGGAAEDAPLPGSAAPPPVALRTLWLLFAAGTVLAAVALTFFTWGRLLLVLLPLGNALAGVAWGSEPELVALRARLGGGLGRWLGREATRDREGTSGRERTQGWEGTSSREGIQGREGTRGLRRLAHLLGFRRAATAALLLLVALLAAKTFLFRLPAFVDRHPYGEVAALRALAERVPPGTVLAGTSPFLGRYLDRPYLGVPDAFGPEVGQPDLYLERLRTLLREADAAFLVTGPVDLRDRPAALLDEEAPVAWLRRWPPAELGSEAATGGVRVWKVSRERSGEG